MRIRQATPADRDAVCAIAAAGMREFGIEPDFDGIDAALGAFGHGVAIVELVLEVAGRVGGSVIVSGKDGASGKLSGFYVDAGLRGRGAGARLLAAAEVAARAAGLRELELETWGHMLAAVRLYECSGWIRGRDPSPESGADRRYHRPLLPPP